MDKWKLSTSKERLKTEVNLLLSANRKLYNYVASIGTTTDDFEWPWITASAARAISAVASCWTFRYSVALWLCWKVSHKRSQILVEGPLKFLTCVCKMAHFSTYRKIWLTFAQWYPFAKAGKEAACNTYVSKSDSPFWAVCSSKFVKFL